MLGNRPPTRAQTMHMQGLPLALTDGSLDGGVTGSVAPHQPGAPPGVSDSGGASSAEPAKAEGASSTEPAKAEGVDAMIAQMQAARDARALKKAKGGGVSHKKKNQRPLDTSEG